MKEVMDNTVTVIKNALSATPIDKDRLVVGTDDGLFCVDLERDGKSRFFDELPIENIYTNPILQKFAVLVMAKRSTKLNICKRSS